MTMRRLLFGALSLFASMGLSAVAFAADIQGKDMTIATTERPVKVEFYKAPGTAKHPTALMLHGGGGWGGAEGRIDNFRHYASELANRGFDTYMVYYYSEADAKGMAELPSRRTYTIGRFPAWAKLVSEVTAYAKKQPDANGRVGLVGFSNGGNLSAHATPLDQNIDAAVVQYGGVSRVPGVQPKRFPPLLIMHGEADTQQPMALGQKLVDQAKPLGGPVEWVTFPGEKHGFASDLSRPAAQDAFKHTVAFLDKYLKGE